MPIEIRELVIKAAVANSNAGSKTTSSSKEESTEDAIQLAMEQVSEMKRKENER